MISKKDLDEKIEIQRHIAEEEDAKRRAEKLNLPYLDLISVRVPTEIKAMKLVPEKEAKTGLLVPIQIVNKKLTVALFDPEIPETKSILDELAKSYELNMVVVSKRGLQHAWTYYIYVFPETGDVSGKVSIDDQNLQTLQASIKSLTELTEALTNFKSPLVSQSLELILAGALALKSSDIHLEPQDERGVLRFRIDGILHEIYHDFSLHAYDLLITRIKLLSNLKINIRDQAQDGRFTIDLKDRDIEIRTSVIPSEYGETIVMRLLDPLSLKVDLEEL